MNRLYTLLAAWGISPAIFWVIAPLLVCAVLGLAFTFCGKKKVIVPPIDETVIQSVQSKNTAVREAKLDAVINQVNEQSIIDDARIAISDENRREIKKEMEKSVMRGQNVTAEDFQRLLEEKQQ